MLRLRILSKNETSALLVTYIIILKNKKMINNITKYFSRVTTHNIVNNKGPLTAINNVKLQHQKILIINRILVNFFNKFYILISKPIFTITPNGVKISILYYLPKLKSFSKIRPSQRLTSNTKRTSLKSRVQKAYWNKFTTNLVEINYNSINTKDSLNSNAKLKQREFSRSRLTFLVLLLSKILKTNVQLEIVRLKYVYHDSNILAQFLGINSHRSTYGQIKNLLWKRVTTQTNSIKTELQDKQTNKQYLLHQDDISPVTKLTGFKIKISGRLARQRVVPKKTVKTTYKGAISPNKYNLVDQAIFTGKNKKGAYSIRVWTSHGTTPNIP